MLPRWLVISIVCLVSCMWTANVVVGLIDATRGVEGLNWIFGLIVGGTLTAGQPIGSRIAQAVVDRATKLTGGSSPPEDEGKMP